VHRIRSSFELRLPVHDVLLSTTVFTVIAELHFVCALSNIRPISWGSCTCYDFEKSVIFPLSRVIVFSGALAMAIALAKLIGQGSGSHHSAVFIAPLGKDQN
jgi:hypothetical protein